MEVDYSKKMGVEFYNLNTLGELNYRFQILDPQKPKRYSLLRPVIIPNIIIEKSKFEDAEYLTGYLNPQFNFLDSHLYFHYVCLKNIAIKKYYQTRNGFEIVKNRVIIYFNVYSKNFSESEHISLEIDLNQDYIPSPKLICDTINWLNLYVDEENDINKLKQHFPIDEIQKYLQERAIGIVYNKPIILRTISKLEFEYFSNGVSRARRDDDYFWNEIELSNLPENEYLRILIRKSLSDSGYEEVQPNDIKKKDKVLVFKTKSHTMGNMFWARTKEEFKPEQLNDLTNILKIGMHLNYNELECLFGMIKI